MALHSQLPSLAPIPVPCLQQEMQLHAIRAGKHSFYAFELLLYDNAHHARVAALQVIPFLVLAVGVDNVFILADALARTDEAAPLPARMGAALAAAGPSITLAACAGALHAASRC
jgi:hypothetical protein